MNKLAVNPDFCFKFSDIHNNLDRAEMKKPGKTPSGAFSKGSVALPRDKDVNEDGFILTQPEAGNIALRLNPGEPVSSKAMDKLIQDLAMVREII